MPYGSQEKVCRRQASRERAPIIYQDVEGRDISAIDVQRVRSVQVRHLQVEIRDTSKRLAVC